MHTYLAIAELIGDQNWRFTITDQTLNRVAHSEVVFVADGEGVAEKTGWWVLHRGYGIPLNTDHRAGWEPMFPSSVDGSIQRPVVIDGALVEPVAPEDTEWTVTFTNALAPRMSTTNTFTAFDDAMDFARNQDNWPDYNNVRVRVDHIDEWHYHLGYASLRPNDPRRSIYSIKHRVTDYESPSRDA